MQKMVSLAALLHGRTFIFSDGLKDKGVTMPGKRPV